MKITVFTKGLKALNLASALIEPLEENGCIILDSEIMFLAHEQCDIHYHHVVDKPFYGEVWKMFEECPSLFLLVEGDLETVLKVVGEFTDPAKCNLNSFRKKYGENMTYNVCHRSGSEEDAADEYERFWGKDGFIQQFRRNPLKRLEVVDYFRRIGMRV
jgi:nucleoside-diphosphate kinase